MPASVQLLLPPLPVPEGPELLALSGGRDSVALLHLLAGEGRPLIVCHLNHGLRGRESGQDAAFVRRLAQRYGLPCEVEKADVAVLARREGLSIETAARKVRYDFLHRMAARHGAARIWLAHHADDQAETILANLCRGTGPGGLKGMLPESGSAPLLCRPLLGISRAAIEAYIEEQGLAYREDASNRSLHHRRNRLRHEVLPLLNAVYARDVAPVIVRLGRQAARDESFWQEQIQSLLQKEQPVKEDGRLALSSAVKSLHPALLCRLLHHWLVQVHQVPQVDAGLIDRVLVMLQPGGPARQSLPGNHLLRRKAGHLRIEAGIRD